MIANPLLTMHNNTLPDFNKIKPEHFEPALTKVLNDFNDILWKQVLNTTAITWENTILPLEIASEQIDKVWKVISHLHAVCNTKEVRVAYDLVLPKITEFNAELMQNELLYQLYIKLKESKAYQQYTPAQKTIINHAIRNFRLSGVNLDPTKRQQFKNIKQRLSDLGNQFHKNVIDATHAWQYHITLDKQTILAGIPEHSLNIAKQKAAKQQLPGWLLTLDFPCYHAVITFAKDRQLRKTLYTAYHTKASDQSELKQFDNTEIINEILKLKQQLAVLVGYNNYTEYSLVSKMAETPQQVLDFLDDLATHCKPFALQEIAELTEFARKTDQIAQLEAWDLSYYSELYKKNHYDISQEVLRPYFPEPQVLTGMFKLAERLFGIQITEITNFTSWDPHIKLFEVKDQAGKLRGKFYTDLYARDHKRSGAWMADCYCRIKFPNDTMQTPLAFMAANFRPPAADHPALLSHDEVLTLFHEFGHCLHHILTLVDYPSVSGTNGVAWDAVELPSQFMENWAWEWEVVKELSKHYQTGEALPKAQFDKLLAVKNFHIAMHMLRQIEFSIFDFKLHLNSPADQGKTVQQILDAVRAKIAVVPIPEFNRFQHSFSHIFDGAYDSGYYSYKWAEVLSSDAFEKFVENGTFNAEIGQQFREIILEQGGSREAMDLYIKFRGRKPNNDAFLKHNGLK